MVFEVVFFRVLNMRSGLEVVFFEEESAENLLSMRLSKRAITSSPVYRSSYAKGAVALDD